MGIALSYFKEKMFGNMPSRIQMFGNMPSRILMVGLDGAVKTTILYKV